MKPQIFSPVKCMEGGGEMCALARAKDWSQTPVGDPQSWPQSLCTTLSIILQSKFPMFLWWGKELTQFYNDAYRPSLGDNGKHPIALGQNGEDCWPEIWPTIKPLIDQVLGGGESVWLEDQLIPIYRNGKIEDVYWTFGYSPVINESGKIAGVLVICDETTEKIKNLKALESQEKKIRNIFSQAPVAVAIFKGPTFVTELANEKVLEYWGRTLEQVINKPLFLALPEATGQGFEELLKGVLTTGQRFAANEIAVNLMRNGKMEKTFINFVYEPYYDFDGTISGIIVLANEITEQVLSRKKIEESESRFRSLVNEAIVATAVYTGEEMKIEIANEAMIKTFGKGTSIIGKTVKDALPEIEDQPFLKQLEHVYKTGETYFGKEDRVDVVVDGKMQIFYYSHSYKALRDTHEEIYGILNMAVDVTEQVVLRKKIEADVTEQKLFAEELESQVQRRTAELMESNRNLLQSNESLEQFASIASHDLQEPLRKIQTFTLLLEQRFKDEISADAKIIIDKIKNSSQRMSLLIRDVLNYSSITQSAHKFVLTDLTEILNNILIDFELQVKENNIIINTENLPSIQAIPIQVNQLFYNLLSNSIKFSKSNVQPVINISSIKMLPEEIKYYPDLNQSLNYYKIMFTDNGIGFDQQFAEDIFSIFHRLNDVQQYTGTGIGLALCKRIADTHHGKIYAESRVNKGASFFVILPGKQPD